MKKLKHFCGGQKAVYERFMQQRPELKEREDSHCRGCPYHRPNWKYRYCVYRECPYVKGLVTFRTE